MVLNTPNNTYVFKCIIISLVVMAGLVWSHDPKSYTGRSFSFWQVLPSQAGQRVGSRQIDDWIAGSRTRVVLTGRYNLVYSGWELLLFWENTAIVGRCCIHQVSNQQPKENFQRDSTCEWVSEWVSEWVHVFHHFKCKFIYHFLCKLAIQMMKSVLRSVFTEVSDLQPIKATSDFFWIIAYDSF